MGGHGLFLNGDGWTFSPRSDRRSRKYVSNSGLSLRCDGITLDGSEKSSMFNTVIELALFSFHRRCGFPCPGFVGSSLFKDQWFMREGAAKAYMEYSRAKNSHKYLLGLRIRSGPSLVSGHHRHATP